MKPPVPANEGARLAELQRSGLLDSKSEAVFDELVAIAAKICGVPIALVSLVDEHRQWFKANLGLNATETHRDLAFCAHAITGEGLFEVPDATADVRFSQNPLVVEHPSIRFYAGAPLITLRGHALGTLCVIDQKPHDLDEWQRDALSILARQVSAHIDLRLQARDLSDSQTELDIFFDVALDVLCIVAPQGSFLRVNKEACAVLGRSEAELVDAPFLEFVHPDDVARSQAALGTVAGGAELRQFECRFVRGDGTVRTLLWNVRPNIAMGRIFCIGRDVSEQRAEEAEARRLRSMLDRARDMIGVFNTTTHQFQYVNEGAVVSTGRSRLELLNMRPWDLTPSLDEQAFRQAIAPLASGERVSISIDTLHAHADGTDFPVEIVVQLLKTDAMDPSFVAVVRDMTERQEVDRMKRQFLSTVSHELRTPLTSIRGALVLLEQGIPVALPSDALELLGIACQNSDRLLALVNDLLDIEKLQSANVDLTFTECSARALAVEAVTSVRGMANAAGVALHLEAPGEEMLSCDGPRVVRVLLNLLSNAIKFSDPGGRVDVTVFVDHDCVRFEVADQGPGVAPEHQAAIFEPFRQVEGDDSRSRPGTGLGLAICTEIAEAHGGEVGLRSVLDQGSVFWLSLPIQSIR